MLKKGLIIAVLLAAPAAASAEDAARLPFFGSAPWGFWRDSEAPPRWDGDYFRMSTGYSVTSIRKVGTVSGPTIGAEGGRMWRDGRWVHGVSADLDYMHPGFRNIAAQGPFAFGVQDFQGGARFKSGYLVRPDLLVYGSVGVTAMHYTVSRPHGVGGKDSEFVIRPDMRAGAVWAVNDKMSVTVEVGIRPPLR